jgi:hypothetical protein
MLLAAYAETNPPSIVPSRRCSNAPSDSPGFESAHVKEERRQIRRKGNAVDVG